VAAERRERLGRRRRLERADLPEALERGDDGARRGRLEHARQKVGGRAEAHRVDLFFCVVVFCVCEGVLLGHFCA
jgi:hypothetical protein